MGDGDTDVKEDIHLRDLGAATTSLISRADGAAGAKGDSLSVEPVISGDGSVVAFRSYAENLDTTGAPYGPSVGILAYTRELATSTTRLVSRAGLTGAAPADVTVSPLALSADGAVVAYTISGDFPYTLTGAAPINADAVVVRHRATGAQIVVRVADRRDPSGSSEAAGATAPALNADGSCVAFSVKGTGLLPFVAADTRQVFVRVLSGDCGTATPTAPGGPATPGGPAAAKTTPPVALPHRAVRPVLSKLSLSAKRFRLAAGKTASAAKKATPKGTRIRFTLSAPATVALRFERRSSGRRVGKACLAATAKRAKRKRCTRYLTRFTLLRTVKQAGAVSVAFTGRMGKRRLSPGRYRVVLTATNAGGASKALTAAFTVVRR